MTAFYRVNFQMANNEDIRQSFALADSAEAPVSLLNTELQMDIECLDGTDVLELSTINGRIAIVDAALGQFELVVPAVEMRTLLPGVYRHDLLMTLAGQVQRIWEGTLTLDQGVTE